MPQGGNIPIGLDNVALMPCGCNEEEADIKHWLIGMNGWTRTQTIQGRLKMGVSSFISDGSIFFLHLKRKHLLIY